MAKPGNENYDCGAVPLDRVRRWRAANPGYWRPKGAQQEADDLVAVLDAFALRKSCDALRKTWPPLLVALLGLMVRFRKIALRKTIAGEVRASMMAGYALLGLPSPQPEIGK
ncbi:MAG: hypothetical protein QM790_16840 [Nibricoccus sp.]